MTRIATPYVLPFEAYHSSGPLFAIGRDVRVDVELAAPASQAATDALHGVLIAFTQLASTGALAGERIPPWDSKVADHSTPTPVTPTHLSWILNGCVLDEAALLILVQLFLDPNVEHPIRRVSVAAYGSTSMQLLAHDADVESPYPRAYGQIPFTWTIDDDAMDSPSVTVRFRARPKKAQREDICERLLTWAAATAMGAYPVAPELPRDCGVAIDPDIPFVDTEIDWALMQFRAEPDALLGLVNALAVISHAVAPIEEVRIE
jgi:hypothetical protein